MPQRSTSEARQAYVWAWLPGQEQPVPVGLVEGQGRALRFGYAASYLARSDAVSLWPAELPLVKGWQRPSPGRAYASVLRDSAPDAWGRRVILDRLVGARRSDADLDALSELTYLTQADSNRVGALDFQPSPSTYVGRVHSPSLDELSDAARALDDGRPLSPHLRAVLASGTGIGGARPKALLVGDDGRQYVAKFATSTDPMPVVSAEAAATWLATQVGIDAPAVTVVESAGRRVLLSQRFDRPAPDQRRMVLSAMTFTGWSQSALRPGSYNAIAEALRTHAAWGVSWSEQVFRRVAFAMMTGNTDDHLRNHAAFWDGHHLALTPAFDLSPGTGFGESYRLALSYGADGRREVRLARLIEVADQYAMTKPQARAIINEMLDLVREHWDEASERAHLTRAEADQLWGHQILNPAIEYDLTRRR